MKPIPPRWSSPVTKDEMLAGDGAHCINYIHTYCRVTKDTIGGRAGSLLRLRPWQQKEFYRLLARDPKTGVRKHRTAIKGVARKNGKSAETSALGLYLADTGPHGGEVYVCAGDKEQARIVFEVIKKMIALDPYLSNAFIPYKDEIVLPTTDTVIKVLSSEAFTKEGLNPTAVLFDEVHVQPTDELWDVMSLAMGAREEPLMVGITTAGSKSDRHGNDSLCYRMYNYGKQVASGEIEDPTFYFTWWEPAKGDQADHRDESVWAEANPGLGDIVSIEDMRSLVKRTHEAEFRTKRTNVWTSNKASAIPFGKWDECTFDWSDYEMGPDVVTFQAGETTVESVDLFGCVLFLDGSWAGDSTGVVGCTRDGYVFKVCCYEKTAEDDDSWRVPVNAVKDDIRKAFAAGARMLLLDPHRWQQTASDLMDEGFPVIEWPTNSIPRIVPAWKDFYNDVLDGVLSHDGDPQMSRHVDNMVLKIDAQGARPIKEHRMSTRHIDLGICAIGAYANRDLELEEEGKKRAKLWVASSK